MQSVGICADAEGRALSGLPDCFAPQRGITFPKLKCGDWACYETVIDVPFVEHLTEIIHPSADLNFHGETASSACRPESIRVDCPEYVDTPIPELVHVTWIVAIDIDRAAG